MVRCNKHHLCKEIKYYCHHAKWHEYTSHCSDCCDTLEIMGFDKDVNCIEQEQEFISEEEMEIC